MVHKNSLKFCGLAYGEYLQLADLSGGKNQYLQPLPWVLLTGELHGNWISGEFIFMVGLVFIISQVFKRGVEIQAENDLTV